MQRKWTLFGFVALLATPAGAIELVKEGLWELSVLANVGGQPIASSPLTLRQCVTQQTAADLMAQLTGGGGCGISNYQQNGNHSSWDLSCSGLADVKGSGEVTIGDASLNGSMQLVVNLNGQQVPMTQTFEARWLGECR